MILLYLLVFRFALWVGFSPLRLAGRIYGRYGFAREFQFRAGDVGLPDEPANTVLERLLTARALIALGVLTIAVQAVLDPPSALRKLASIGSWQDGLVVLLTAPVGISLLAPLLVVLARGGHRARTARALVRPVATGLFSALLLVIVAAPPIPVVTGTLDRIVGWLSQGVLRVPLVAMAGDERVPPVLLFPLLWVLLFFVGAAYLAQRNGLCARKDHDLLWLLAPLLSVWSSWWIALTKLGAPPEQLAALEPWEYTLSWLATPVTVTVLAAVEIRKLRADGIRFRTRNPARLRLAR